MGLVDQDYYLLHLLPYFLASWAFSRFLPCSKTAERPQFTLGIGGGAPIPEFDVQHSTYGREPMFRKILLHGSVQHIKLYVPKVTAHVRTLWYVILNTRASRKEILICVCSETEGLTDGRKEMSNPWV